MKILKIISVVLVLVLSNSANAALVNGLVLTIEDGSYWEIDMGSSFATTSIIGNNHLRLGTIQTGSINHYGDPDGTEVPNIDLPGEFIGTTLHQTTSATNVISSIGNTATIDFSGWEWVWNFFSHNMSTGAWDGNPDGVANVICAVDCLVGDSYSLTFSGRVPLASPSGIGGERYRLYLTGTVSDVPVPAALWLFGSGFVGLAGMARRKKM